MSVVAGSLTALIDERTALLGVTTPLSDIAVPGRASDPVLAIVSVHLGALSADIGTGAVVRGGGSSMLWISGSVAEVNAKLATVTYTSSAGAADELTVMLLDARGTLSTPVLAPLSIVPLSTATSSIVAVNQGTLTLDTRIVDGPSIALREVAGGPTATTAILINTTVSARSALSIQNDNAVGGVMPRLAIAGHVELDGVTDFAGNGVAVTLAKGATLLNEGTMTIAPHAASFTGAGTLSNDGAITLRGDGIADATVRIDTAIGGTGQIALDGGASLSLGAAVAATETILLGGGASTVHLARPDLFAGVIAGFSRGDTVVLDGASATAGIYSTNTGSSDGTLSLFDGQTAIGSLRFSAPETGAAFQLGADAAGNTTISLAPASTAAQPADTDVYRFFDAVHGTQFLTQDAAERDAVIGSRPDLRYEGAAFRAVNPDRADPSAAAVYRFFDRTNGTHFLTASATERDALLGSRPDLVFEPGSTIVEHGSAQAGDVAVYRFFDQHSGAHFFTGSVGERATILATRPDMTVEGIAFYAPAG